MNIFHSALMSHLMSTCRVHMPSDTHRVHFSRYLAPSLSTSRNEHEHLALSEISNITATHTDKKSAALQIPRISNQGILPLFARSTSSIEMNMIASPRHKCYSGGDKLPLAVRQQHPDILPESMRHPREHPVAKRARLQRERSPKEDEPPDPKRNCEPSMIASEY
jgi:hypothetical protein